MDEIAAMDVNAQHTNGLSAPKRISVLGSTGSVGESTLDLVRQSPSDFEVISLTGGKNWKKLAEQALEFRPGLVAIADEAEVGNLSEALSGSGIAIEVGEAGICAAAAEEADWVMAAIVGAAGLAPTLAAVKMGADIAFANKECLVCAGDIFLEQARAANVRLLPVDSEHNAIFQVLEETNRDAVERLILTASGGPFRKASLSEMEAAGPEKALAHPNWSMGAKISIDSATMMNKGLELIEAAYLFGMDECNIEILVHPESVIHSMVGYQDGSVLAQLGSPDMRTPIAHTLAWPHRMHAKVERLDFSALGKLTFEAPDNVRFPALRLARDCLQTGGGAPTVLNAANEVAVAAFLKESIGFMQIVPLVRKVIDHSLGSGSQDPPESLEEVLELDRQAREFAQRLVVES